MLVSGVAHEVNNPLTSVLGYAQLLVRQETDPAKLRMLGKVASEAGRAGKIVQNLLTFSRKQKSEKKLTDVNEVLDLVLDLQSYGLRVNNVEVVRRLSPGLPPVLADPHQLQQVFLNLLTNAEHALADVDRKRRIVVETRPADGSVRIAISDNGPGISADNLGRIFLPFFTTKSLGKGTGLGLAICYGIVEDHGGTITAESRPGDGASFVIGLPAAEPVVGASVTPESADVAEVPQIHGRLLVIDDEEAISDLVRDLLEPQGWTVEVARDGSEAMGVLESRSFDVLLVDMRMPGMDGRTFYEALRKTRPDMAGRIVFATGDTGCENTSHFLEDTGRPVLAKPYEIRKLLEVVTRTALPVR